MNVQVETMTKTVEIVHSDCDEEEEKDDDDENKIFQQNKKND